MMCSSRTCNCWKFNLYLGETEERCNGDSYFYVLGLYIYFFFMLDWWRSGGTEKRNINLRPSTHLESCVATRQFFQECSDYESKPWRNGRVAPLVTCRYRFKGGNCLFAETLWEYIANSICSIANSPAPARSTLYTG